MLFIYAPTHAVIILFRLRHVVSWRTLAKPAIGVTAARLVLSGWHLEGLSSTHWLIKEHNFLQLTNHCMT